MVSFLCHGNFFTSVEAAIQPAEPPPTTSIDLNAMLSPLILYLIITYDNIPLVIHNQTINKN